MAQALEVVAGMLSGGAAQARALDWAALRYQHTAAVRAALAARYAPATANKALAALRGVLKEAWRLGLVAADDYQRAVDLAAVRGSTLPAGRALQPGEIRALFVACAADDSPGGARDAALLAVLYGGGLRRAEAVALEAVDYDGETGALTVRSGKGHKARIAYATNGGKAALEAWLAVRGTGVGALFCPVHKGGRVEVRRMTEQAVWTIIEKRGGEAGVAHFSPTLYPQVGTGRTHVPEESIQCPARAHARRALKCSRPARGARPPVANWGRRAMGGCAAGAAAHSSTSACKRIARSAVSGNAGRGEDFAGVLRREPGREAWHGLRRSPSSEDGWPQQPPVHSLLARCQPLTK